MSDILTAILVNTFQCIKEIVSFCNMHLIQDHSFDLHNIVIDWWMFYCNDYL